MEFIGVKRTLKAGGWLVSRDSLRYKKMPVFRGRFLIPDR